MLLVQTKTHNPETNALQIVQTIGSNRCLIKKICYLYGIKYVDSNGVEQEEDDKVGGVKIVGEQHCC